MPVRDNLVARVRRIRPGIAAFVALALVALLAGLWLVPFITPLAAIALFAVGLVAAAALLLSTTRPVDLRLDERGVCKGTSGPVPRSAIAAAVFDRTGREPTLRLLDADGRELIAGPATPEWAAATCSELGLPAPVERCTGTTRPAWQLTLALVVGLVCVIAASIGVHFVVPTMPINMSSAMFPLIMALIARNLRLTIGDLGVVEELLGTKRRIPPAAIARVERTKKGLVLHLHDGAPVDVVLGPFVSGAHREGLIEACAARLEQAVARHATLAVRADVRAALAPQGADASDWVARLRTLGQSGYRAGRPAADELWRVLEDTGESEANRAAAALLLRTELDEANRVRLRVASIDETASRPFRIALQALAEGDDDLAESSAAALLTRRMGSS